jgi:hypothetical protein
VGDDRGLGRGGSVAATLIYRFLKDVPTLGLGLLAVATFKIWRFAPEATT